MPNVFASAGSAARAQNELSLLFVQAHKMVSSESNLPAQTAKEVDVEYGRALTNELGKQEANDRTIKAVLQLAKVAIAIVKLVGAGMSASKGDSKAKSAGDTKAANEMSAGAKTAKTVGTVLGTAVAVGQQVLAFVNARADMNKADKNRKTLDGESGSVDSATKMLDSTGKG
jgi:hypothetical protein